MNKETTMNQDCWTTTHDEKEDFEELEDLDCMRIPINMVPLTPPILLRYGPSPYQDEMGRETIDWHDLYHKAEKSNDEELKEVLNQRFGEGWDPKKVWWKDRNQYYCEGKKCYHYKKHLSCEEILNFDK